MSPKKIVLLDDASWFGGARNLKNKPLRREKSRLQELPIPPRHIQRRDLLTFWYEMYYIARMSGAIEDAAKDYATAVVEGREGTSAARLRAFVEKFDPNPSRHPAGTEEVDSLGHGAGGQFAPKNGDGAGGAKKSKPTAKKGEPAAPEGDDALVYNDLSRVEKVELFFQYMMAYPWLEVYDQEKDGLPPWLVEDLTEADIAAAFEGDATLDHVDFDIDALDTESLARYNRWVERNPEATEQDHRLAYIANRVEMEKPAAENLLGPPDNELPGSFGPILGVERHESLAAAIEDDHHHIHRDEIDDRNINSTYIFGHDDGDYFVKELVAFDDPVTEAAAEGAASNISRLVGMDEIVLPVWDVSDSDTLRIATDYVDGRPFGDVAGRPGLVKALTDQELTQMMVFDYVIGNRDRHSNNVFVDESNDRLLLIDNGFSFVEDNGSRYQASQHVGRPPAAAIYQHTNDSRILSPLVMRRFVERRKDIVAAIPDRLDPVGAGSRLDMVEFLINLDRPVSVGEFYRLMNRGDMDTGGVFQN